MGKALQQQGLWRKAKKNEKWRNNEWRVAVNGVWLRDALILCRMCTLMTYTDG